MSNIDALPKMLCDELTANPDFSDIKFITDYSSSLKNVPIVKPTVALGLERSNIKNKKDDDGKIIKGAWLSDNDYHMAIHLPLNAGGIKASEIFVRLAEYIFSRSDIECTQAGCRRLTFVRSTNTLRLSAFFSVFIEFTV